MLTSQTIKVGMHVRCIYHGHVAFGKTGIVTSLANGNVYIKWDDGSTKDTSWGYASSFEECSAPTRVLTDKDIKEGIKVRCIYKVHPKFNKTGVLGKGSAPGYFPVHWDDGSPWNFWQTASYFEIIDEQVKAMEPIKIGKVPEAGCRVCNKMNDIGIAKCWWCEINNPC